MKTSILKIQLPFLLLCSVVLVINACHKQQTERTTSVSKEERSINAMMEKLKKEGARMTTVYPVNKEVSLQLISRSGESISLAALNSGKLNATYVCDQPGAVNVQTVLESVSRIYDCYPAFKYAATYNVSAPFNIVAANSSITTFGFIGLKKAASGSVIFSEYDIPPVITPLGEDPGNTSNFLFRVTFTSNYVDLALATKGRFVVTAPQFATDCSAYPAVQPYTSVTFIADGVDPFTTPCTRTDKCSITPSMPGMFGSIAGSNVLGVCTIEGTVLSQTHDFEYREITGFNPANWATSGTPGQWSAVPVPSISGSGTTNGTIGYWEVRTLPSNIFISNHVYEFRYRNHMVTGTPCLGVWSVPERYMFN